MPDPAPWPDLKARDIMRSEVITVAETASISEAMRLLVDNRISGMPVTDETGHVVGIVSFRDLLEAMSEGEEVKHFSPRNFYTASEQDDEVDYEEFEVPAEDLSTRVAEVMNAQLLTVGQDESIRDVAATLVEHRVHRVIVTQKNRHVGLLTMTDVLRALVEA